LYGLAPDLDAIMDVARKHNLLVIEDDAETFLALYKGRNVGTIGHAASFSFQSSKHLTAGEGGMIVTDDENLALEIRRFSSLGYAGVNAKKGKITRDDIQHPDYSRHVSVGFNYRMSELCAAVVLGQLSRAEELVQRRIDVANLFHQVVADCSWLVPQRTPADRTNSYWTFVVRLEHPDVSWEKFRAKFRELGGHGVYAAWKLTYQEPMFAQGGVPKGFEAFSSQFQRSTAGLCPVAESLQKKLLQFKTNYWDWAEAERQSEILRKTIAYFNATS
jgi:perosamine synthetase